ncbi:hypothetical protein [uncultured Roseobacter sp.]|uniref:hypothetical protein n=1 Tax=uncultured Roseobacter sp. TaxID=114847 RepID=UPI0026051B0F|nr:hypothetical protein [uncultured Roseobacter sp.]
MKGFAVFTAINLVLPLALRYGLLWTGFGPLPMVFLFCVAMIFALNYLAARRFAVSRRIIWPLQGLNLAAAFFLGTFTVFTALPVVPLLIRTLLGI